jgi:hypothetical protein
MTTPSESGCAAINGLELYCEIHGSGRALVLHGGIAASEAFGPNLPLLARRRVAGSTLIFVRPLKA